MFLRREEIAFLIICDHASNNIDEKYGNLGLEKNILIVIVPLILGLKMLLINYPDY